AVVAEDDVVAVAGIGVDLIVPHTAEDNVRAAGTGDLVLRPARAGGLDPRDGRARAPHGALVADHRIDAAAELDLILAEAAEDRVVRTRVDDVVAAEARLGGEHVATDDHLAVVTQD